MATATLASRQLLSDDSVSAVWTRYRQHPTSDDRQTLIAHYMPLVQKLAHQQLRRLPQSVDGDDLISAGTLGLMDAIDSYDPQQGASFTSFSFHRIRGAMLDEVRAMDWLPRCARQSFKRVEEARQKIRAASGHTATDEEVADSLDMSPRQFSRYSRTGHGAMPLSLDESGHGERDGEPTRGHTIADPRQACPLTQAQRSELREYIETRLPRPQRLVVLLYYFEGMTLAEIGLTMDLSESRVCQILTRTIAELRERIGRADRFC